MAKTLLVRSVALRTPLLARLSLCGSRLPSSSSFFVALPSINRLSSLSHCAVVDGCSIRRRFSVKATHVSGPGSIDSPMMKAMEDKIKEQLNADQVIVRDAYGDGRHVSIDVVSSAFEGQSAVNRQRMVYKAIWEELQTTVHAVDQMTTTTPEEAASSG